MPRDVRLSNIDLDRVGKNLFGALYRGAFSKDQLRIKQPGFYFLNLQSSKQHTYEGETGGTHWTSLYYEPGMIYYFDSFGAPPPETVIRQTRRLGAKGIYFDVIAQPWESELCGWYDLLAMHCIYNHRCRIGRDGLLWVSPNKTLFENVHYNDRMVSNFRTYCNRQFGVKP